ncbi:MAG: hypothetical protein A3C56_08820 [Ignavibacteria bacterium RIFCSPHIGHO2_02_FULL_56_12]|nr:MAG: hypothetical protein A3C56_08820 [Ignavibacteria bacterium RIFCSPHIGHO2_02_FULL_56_12]
MQSIWPSILRTAIERIIGHQSAVEFNGLGEEATGGEKNEDNQAERGLHDFLLLRLTIRGHWLAVLPNAEPRLPL